MPTTPTEFLISFIQKNMAVQSVGGMALKNVLNYLFVYFHFYGIILFCFWNLPKANRQNILYLVFI